VGKTVNINKQPRDWSKTSLITGIAKDSQVSEGNGDFQTLEESDRWFDRTLREKPISSGRNWQEGLHLLIYK
jgi:hypothetical protein